MRFLALIFVLLSTPVFALPTGRANWDCETEPVIFPGFWAFKNLGYVGGPTTIDGARTMAPDVVFMSDKVRLYYLAERQMPVGSKRTVLRVEAPLSDPTNFTPKGIAFEMPASVPVTPPAGASAVGYYAAGPYHASVVPALDANRAPALDGQGNPLPWYMYFASVGSNTGVAKSLDGGETFQLVPNKNPLWPFEVYQIKDETGAMVWRRHAAVATSKPYDFGGSGSSAGVKTPDGKTHLFTTSAAMLKQTYEDLGVTASDVGHPSGQVADIGVGYSVSTDGESFTRKTSQALGVTSPAAKGTGRVVDPRKWDAPNGMYEYIVSRPMVFRDDDVWRMMISTHSTSYRARSLHSSDLINWTWDASPATGTFGLGASGSFDDEHAAYPDCERIGDTYHCYYTGNGYGHVNHAPTGIGYCTAEALN